MCRDPLLAFPIRSYDFALLSRLDLVQSITVKVEAPLRVRTTTSVRTAADKIFGVEAEDPREKVRAGFKPALTKFTWNSANIFWIFGYSEISNSMPSGSAKACLPMGQASISFSSPPPCGPPPTFFGADSGCFAASSSKSFLVLSTLST